MTDKYLESAIDIRDNPGAYTFQGDDLEAMLVQMAKRIILLTRQRDRLLALVRSKRLPTSLKGSGKSIMSDALNGAILGIAMGQFRRLADSPGFLQGLSGDKKRQTVLVVGKPKVKSRIRKRRK